MILTFDLDITQD